MKCLVTGAAGFIGSHLAEGLLDRGHQVVGVDSFTEAYDPGLKEANTRSLRVRNGFRMVRGDLVEVDLEELLEGVDVVFHLAAQAGVRSSWGGEFYLYLHRNVLATQRLLEACKNRALHRFVYASSSSVYGDQFSYPTSEEVLPSPMSPYGVTKLAAEHLCRLYWKNHQVPCVSLRYFTVYGPRQRPDMAFHRFMRAAWTGEPLVLFGDGRQSRDFTYVADVVRANMRAAERGEAGKVYNIGGGSRATVLEVLEVLEKVTGRRAPVRWEPAQRGDVRHTWADLTRASRDLEYEPEVSLPEGLRMEWEWVIELLEPEERRSDRSQTSP
jgi:UDP-glucose 4-epimerase